MDLVGDSGWEAACRVVRCLAVSMCLPVVISCRTPGVTVYIRPHELRPSKILLDSNKPPLTSSGTLPGKNSYKKEHLMKTCSLIVVVAVIMVLSHLAGASQADDTTIRITGHTAGATPFISKVTLEVSNTTVLKSIQFTDRPRNRAPSPGQCQALMPIRTS